MNEKEMILEVLEAKGKPLMAKEISKFIYNDFNGYKLHRSKVRDHLWDENSLKNFVIYNGKPDYTYALKSNALILKNLTLSKRNTFEFIFEQSEIEIGVNDLYSYTVKGKEIHVQTNLKNSDFKKILKALVLSEIQSYNNPTLKLALNKIKANLIDLTTK